MNESRPPGDSQTGYRKYRCDRGENFLQANKVDAAADEFKEALRVDSDCVTARLGLAGCREHKGLIDDAINEYLNVLQIDRRNVPAMFSLGTLFLTKGKINEANRQFQTVLNLDPQHFQARLSIGKCLEKKNQHENALQEYRSIQAGFPDCPDAYFSAARCLIYLDQVPAAVNEYRKAIARAPDRLDIRKALIRLLEEQGYIEEPVREYREILARTPDAVDVRLHMASLMDRGGLIREVIEEYALILELDPKNAFAYKKHGILVRERERIDQLTDRYLGHVIKRMDKIGDHFREGMKMYLDGRFDEALGEFVIEAGENPGPEAHFGTGACRVRAGSLLTAVPHFREAIKHKADFKEAHTMLGVIYERHGLLYEASEEYEQGVKEFLDHIKSCEKRKPDADPRAKELPLKTFQLP